jgi:hypothetical protein
VVQRRVLVFNRDSATGGLQLLDTVQFPLALDNIEPDALAPAGEEAYTVARYVYYIN